MSLKYGMDWGAFDSYSLSATGAWQLTYSYVSNFNDGKSTVPAKEWVVPNSSIFKKKRKTLTQQKIKKIHTKLGGRWNYLSNLRWKGDTFSLVGLQPLLNKTQWKFLSLRLVATRAAHDYVTFCRPLYYIRSTTSESALPSSIGRSRQAYPRPTRWSSSELIFWVSDKEIIA
jgi:hypothetical protein